MTICSLNFQHEVIKTRRERSVFHRKLECTYGTEEETDVQLRLGGRKRRGELVQVGANSLTIQQNKPKIRRLNDILSIQIIRFGDSLCTCSCTIGCIL